MIWEDIIVKGPFRSKRKIRRQADKGRLDIKNKNMGEVHQHINQIINEFENDPEFQRVGQFGIKTSGNAKGKEGLMFYSNSAGLGTDEFLEIAITYLNKLEFKAEKMGNKAILVTKKNAVKKQVEIDIKDYAEMLEKLRQLAQKHNPNAMAHVDKLEEELLHLNTERITSKR
jgi:hypothetical protein